MKKATRRKVDLVLTITELILLNGGAIWYLKIPPAKTIFFCWFLFSTIGIAILTYGKKWSTEQN